MSAFTSTFALVRKDVHSELRTRYALNALIMFVVTAVATILFALRSDQPTSSVLSGLYWVVVFFTAMSGLSRTFVSEEERGTTMTLQLVASPSTVYFAKLIFNTALTFSMTIAVTILYMAVFSNAFVIKTLSIFIGTVVLGSLGFASASTIIAAIVAKANTRGTLYPVLSFPILIVLLMTVMGATTKALDGEDLSTALGDFQILVGYFLAMTGGSYLLFDYVWKD
ncbi:MAG: transporter permease [Bacteroidetes bacterium]|jgi:heme exporter protein B|nr:transporter permease [Bacteroidota bacterium]MBM2840077.1 transporter permease [Bacteroidota bacterium]MDP2886415.1 heme exporter protein CcmB [Ignavibacteria bacterium]